MRIVAKLTTVAALLCAGAEAHAATRWSAYNTCWQDFDVGGEWFCGLRHSTCSSPGKVWCTNSTNGLGSMPPTEAPASKKLAVDGGGWAWVWTNDNKLRFETRNGSFALFTPTIPLTCVRKFVVAGSAVSNPRILALGCNGEVYRFLDGSWFRHFSSGMVDVSVTGSTQLFTILGADDRYRFSGSGGGGTISGSATSTVITETWSLSGGGTASTQHRTSLLAGYTGIFGKDFVFCHPTGIGVGGAWAYSFASSRFSPWRPQWLRLSPARPERRRLRLLALHCEGGCWWSRAR